MRKITKEMCSCLMHLQYKVKSNTTVSIEALTNGIPTIASMYLFGNKIATYHSPTNTLEITNCGWFTNTTKERLNGLPGVKIYQAFGNWYLNGEIWNGSLKKIKLERNDSGEEHYSYDESFSRGILEALN